VTQTDLQATAVPADAGWRDFINWLTAKRVTLCALAFVAVQVGLNAYVLRKGFFQEDDFIIGGLASRSLDLHLLFLNYTGHLMPGAFAMAWLLTHTGGGYDWGLWAGSLVALQALAGLAMLRALRTMFGDRMAILVPLGVFLFTPMTVPTLSWWAAGINSVPMELAIPLAVDQHVRYVRDGRFRNAIFAAFWVLFGLAFFEKSVGIVLLLFALTTAFLVPGSWPEAVRTTLRRHWPAWTLQVAAVVTELVLYLLSLHTSVVKPKTPQASHAAVFSWDLIWRNFVPGAFGGPWRWFAPPFTATSWPLYAVASVPEVLAVMSWVLAALVIGASLWYRSGAGKAWAIMFGWLVVVDIVPVALGRVSLFGPTIYTETLYVADAAPVLALCLALAFLPLKGEQHPYRVRLRNGKLRMATVGALAVVFLAGAVISDVAYQGDLHPQNSRSYLATASAALADAPAGSVIYTGQIPTEMAWNLFGTYSQVQNTLGPLIRAVGGQGYRFATWPDGMTNNFLIFDDQGRLHPAKVAGVSTPSRGSQLKDCLLPAGGMQLPLTAESYSGQLLMVLPYLSTKPVTLAITFGGHQYQLTLPASPLASAYLPVDGPDNAVQIVPQTPDPNICIGQITVGYVVGADPKGTPIPAAPLPG
jgi:hypothetical protein